MRVKPGEQEKREVRRTATVFPSSRRPVHEEQHTTRPRPTPSRTPRTCQRTQTAAASCGQTAPSLPTLSQVLKIRTGRGGGREPAPGVREEATTTESPASPSHSRSASCASLIDSGSSVPLASICASLWLSCAYRGRCLNLWKCERRRNMSIAWRSQRRAQQNGARGSVVCANGFLITKEMRRSLCVYTTLDPSEPIKRWGTRRRWRYRSCCSCSWPS